MSLTFGHFLKKFIILMKKKTDNTGSKILFLIIKIEVGIVSCNHFSLLFLSVILSYSLLMILGDYSSGILFIPNCSEEFTHEHIYKMEGSSEGGGDSGNGSGKRGFDDEGGGFSPDPKKPKLDGVVGDALVDEGQRSLDDDSFAEYTEAENPETETENPETETENPETETENTAENAWEERLRDDEVEADPSSGSRETPVETPEDLLSRMMGQFRINRGENDEKDKKRENKRVQVNPRLRTRKDGHHGNKKNNGGGSGSNNNSV